ncbi:MAG TPA: phage tail protein [Arcobacter sp.]|jgi:phage tail protein X|nr:phage tail protein [Arcobacter sp.]
MKTFTAQNGDRLDQIVFKEYKTLAVFDKVLETNPHLATKVILEDNDKVNLPVLELPKAATKKVKSLW